MCAMQEWIGQLKDGVIRGLFASNRTVSLAEVQLAGQPLNAGDIVRVQSVQASTEVTCVAAAGSSLATVYQELAERSLDPCHPQQCEQEAQRWLETPGFDAKDLQDLTHLPFVTIDNADSRDLDQALFIDRDTTDQLRVYYALADASYYVRPGSALFDEAVARAVTYYVPGLAVPMLPRALSEDLVSLNPDVPRRALVFTITVGVTGDAIKTEVCRALIRSRAKLAYDAVQEFYDAEAQSRRTGKGNQHGYAAAEYTDSLLNLQRVGQCRIQHAQQRDVVDYQRHEPRIVFNKQQTSFAIELRRRSDCEKYNEQVSLLCNMEGARLLEDLHHHKHSVLQSIFRVHSPPLQERLSELRHSIAQLCDAHELTDEWRWQPAQPLADYLSSLPAADPVPDVPRTGLQNADLRRAIERMILLTNRASFFSDEPGPHHALGVKSYARFSSPMREIAGIFTHKELLEALQLEPASDSGADEQLQQAIVNAANAAKRLQKELDNEFHLKAIDSYFHNDLSLPLADRPVRTAVIMGMRGGRMYAAVHGFGTDVKVYLDDLGQHFNTRYQVDGVRVVPKQAAAPVFKIGDRINLQLQRYDAGNRRFVLLPVT